MKGDGWSYAVTPCNRRFCRSWPSGAVAFTSEIHLFSLEWLLPMSLLPLQLEALVALNKNWLDCKYNAAAYAWLSAQWTCSCLQSRDQCQTMSANDENVPEYCQTRSCCAMSRQT